MDGYNFWQDFFDTYQSLSDWMKFVWLVIPPAFILGLIALLMRFRINSKQVDHGFTGRLVYSIHRDDQDQFHIVSHAPQIDGQPTLMLFDSPGRDPDAPQNPSHRP